MKKIVTVLLLVGIMPLAAEPGSLVLSDAWVRALPPGQPNTAAYLTVTNTGGTTVVIVGASASVADTTEMHTSREVEGYQRMEQLAQLEVAPGQSVAFGPGGNHLMLFGLKRMPAPGEQVEVCLLAAGGEAVCIAAEVRKSGQSHEHHQH